MRLFASAGKVRDLQQRMEQDKVRVLAGDIGGSFGLKMCVRPSAGALNTQKNNIGHQLRISAGTAIGTVSVGSL